MVAGERNRGPERRRFHAWQRADAVQRLLPESDHRRVLVVLRGPQVHLQLQHVLGPEAGIHR
jgi:hypothetical protein